MPLYKYTISNENGKIISNTVHSKNQESLQKLLTSKGKVIISLKKETKKKKWYEWSSPLKQKEILLIIRRIAEMVDQGFTVVESLKSLELQSTNPMMKEVVQSIRSQVELGSSLAEAISIFPRYFSSIFINLVKVGERTGTLPKVLRYLEKQERHLYNMKKKALSAMIYPIVIISLMIVIAIGMVLFLIPFLKDIFEDFKSSLPLPTRMLMGSEDFLKQYWWMLIGGLIGVIISIKYLLKNSSSRKIMEKTFIHMPIIGNLIKSYNSAQIIRTFSTLNKSKIPMIETLDIVMEVPTNSLYKNAMTCIRDEVNKGTIFSKAMSDHPKLFSPLVIESIKMGEKSGSLGNSMDYLAKVYEEEVKEKLKIITAFIQPFLLIIVGVLVAVFALSIIVPLQRIPSLMQQ